MPLTTLRSDRRGEPDEQEHSERLRPADRAWVDEPECTGGSAVRPARGRWTMDAKGLPSAGDLAQTACRTLGEGSRLRLTKAEAGSLTSEIPSDFDLIADGT